MGVLKSLIYKGDTFKGVINLRLKDACDPNKVSPFPIETGSTIEIRFPGGVVLSTANVGEITVVDAALSVLSYEGDPTKSANLKVGVDQSLTVVVTQGISTEVYTFQQDKFLTVKVRAN